MKGLITSILAALCLSSCIDKSAPQPIVERTLLIYMSANNSLSSNSYDNIKLIKKGFAEKKTDYRVIIFWRRPDAATQMVEIVRIGGTVFEVVLKSYGNNINASDPATLRMAIEDMKHLAPAHNYTLDMWSHALGWLPVSTPRRPSSGGAMYSFGDDVSYTTREMNVTDMADAIPDGLLDVILFDCCYMGNIETLYELRAKANYVLASTAEVTVEGMPYDKLLSALMRGSVQGLKDACDLYCENSYPDFNPTVNYGVMALYDMNKIQAVATAYADVVATVGQEYIYQNLTISSFNTQTNYAADKVQRYDRTNSTPWAYDMQQVVAKSMAADPTALEAALSEFVIHNRYASNGYVYIPGPSAGVTITPPTSSLNRSWRDFYLTLDWHKATFTQQ